MAPNQIASPGAFETKLWQCQRGGVCDGAVIGERDGSKQVRETAALRPVLNIGIEQRGNDDNRNSEQPRHFFARQEGWDQDAPGHESFYWSLASTPP